jgi:hypothetical protein
MNSKIARNKSKEKNIAYQGRKVITKNIEELFAGKFMATFIILFVIVAGLVIYQQTAKLRSQTKTVIIKKQVLIRRSHDLGFIYRGLTGKAIDVNTGKIVLAARIFSVNDATVYLELDLQTPPKGTLVDYIRYKDGRYVDHGEVIVATSNTKNMLFNWTINKLLAGITNGSWKVATYTNGILAKRILYEVKNNKVSYVYPDKRILSTDPDYSLSTTLKGSLAKGY